VDIIVEIANCLPNKEIAIRLSMKEGTVKTYLSGIFRKMGYEVGPGAPRARLAKWARENADLLGPKAA
jgi:DNA-binding NarL/FixJ family response regulator